MSTQDGDERLHHSDLADAAGRRSECTGRLRRRVFGQGDFRRPDRRPRRRERPDAAQYRCEACGVTVWTRGAGRVVVMDASRLGDFLGSEAT